MRDYVACTFKRRKRMAKWDLSKLDTAADTLTPVEGSDTSSGEAAMMYIASIERKADIIRMDAQMTPERLGIKMKAEEILALTKMLKAAMGIKP